MDQSKWINQNGSIKMDQSKLKESLYKGLELDTRLWEGESGEDKVLNQILLLDLVEKTDSKVLELLFQDKELRVKFFLRVKDAYVFKARDFQFFIEGNKVYNSYTMYKNRIGLSDGKGFLKDRGEVVLNWPYKDCVLEGGQSTEEGFDTYFEYSKKEKQYEKKQSKRKEVFFNQVLAQDEIDRLFDEKGFINWKRYNKDNKDGSEEVKMIKRARDGLIKENLIIKGNNLLALHSLKKQFAGKVKLIYIDPPYNTGNDTFRYNDRFNHSTWLTFMKNRLEVARELLRDDGVIFVQCDDNEQAYLKVLLDEVFWKGNFVANYIWKNKLGGGNDSSIAVIEHEYSIVYSKNINEVLPFECENKDNGKYVYEDEYFQERGKFAIEALYRSSIRYSDNLYYPIKSPDGTEVYPDDSDKGSEKHIWRWSKDTFEKKLND